MNERGKPYEGLVPEGTPAAGPKVSGERRVALVIGNGAYSHAGVLTNPINDAREMGTVLRRFGFDVIDGLDVARDPMEDLLFSFEKKVVQADVSLLFYAGHGLQVKGCNYLLPIDANVQGEAHLKRRAFSLNEILDIMGRNQRTSIVFLDACRNNPFTRQLRELGIRDAGSKGLAKVDRVPGSLIAFATEADDVAQDGKGDNSPFTSALLKHIPIAGLSLTDMMIDVRNDVIAETEREQQPWVQYSLEKRFYFVPEEAEPGASTNITPPASNFSAEPEAHSLLTLAAQEWATLKDSTNIARLQRFAQHFAGTYYAGEALERIGRLEAEAARLEAERAAEEHTRQEGEKTERQTKTLTERYRSEGRIHIEAPIIHGAPDGWCKPGNGQTEWFKDIECGPEMIVVPAEKFIMGSPEDEPERESWQKGTESPQREVTIVKPFAVGRCAVTFDEWDAYVADAGGKSYKPKDQGWGRGRLPVINVSWEDIQTYISWLSDKTGQHYRLLSEAEWEYVARAGTTTTFWWGKEITPDQANYDGSYLYAGGGNKGEYREKTVPVDSFDANPWGLYNVHGNVWEWCEDFWNDNYEDAPTDGSAWLQYGVRDGRVVRGGSWDDDPRGLRSAYRNGYTTDGRGDNNGFRLARTLNAKR